MTRLFTLLAATVAVLALGGSATAGPIVLDKLSVPLALNNVSNVTLTASNGTPTVTSDGSTSPGNILGTRVTTVVWTGNPPSSSTAAIGGGSLIVTAPSLNSTNTTTLTYSNFGTLDFSTATILNLNVTDLTVGVGGSATVEVGFKNNANVTNFTSLLVGDISGVGPLSVPLSSIAAAGIKEVILRFELHRASLTVETPVGGFFLQANEPVPEPATLAVLGLFGVAGVIRARRRSNLAA